MEFIIGAVFIIAWVVDWKESERKDKKRAAKYKRDLEQEAYDNERLGL